MIAVRHDYIDRWPTARSLHASCALLFAFCCASSVSAHDFWVQPSAYWASADAQTSMTLQVGHGPFRQRSPIPLRRILRFDAIAADGSAIDLRDRLSLGDAAKDGDVRLRDPGAYLLVLQTDDHAQTHLPAIRFNDYLTVEGLTPALEQRTREHRMDADGSERYSRCAKTIVHVGPPVAELQAQITQPLGLPLEIVPEVNPYAEPRPSALPVRILFHGHPLAGALVKLTQLEHDDAPFDTHLTDHAGQARFSMPASGTWLLNVIWTEPSPSSSDTDFDTVFSSLSFGFPSGPLASAH